MPFEKDVFISYAREDNILPPDNQDGWITTFHKWLEYFLIPELPRDVKVWRDVRDIKGNSDLDAIITEAISDAAILVSILSPRYIRSEWCMKELRLFFEAAESAGGIFIDSSSSRVFKVVKTQVPRSQEPDEFKPFIGYDFFEKNEEGRIQKYNEILGEEMKAKFVRLMGKLSEDIVETLNILEDNSSDPIVVRSKIYVAETTADLSEARDYVVRELKMNNYEVLPSQPLPDDPISFSHSVKDAIDLCAMSIHMISPRLLNQAEPLQKNSIEASSWSKTKRQVDIAAEQALKKRNMKRVLWVPTEGRISKGDIFLRTLQSEPDFVSTSLENLKVIIYDRLSKSSEKNDVVSDAIPATYLTREMPSLYLDCNKQDIGDERMAPFLDYLRSYCQVVLPTYNEEGILSKSEALLSACESVLIYYGKSDNRIWLQSRMKALKKARFGRLKPLLAEAVYVAGPATHNKAELSLRDILVIDGLQGFSPNLLEPFLSQIGGRV